MRSLTVSTFTNSREVPTLSYPAGLIGVRFFCFKPTVFLAWAHSEDRTQSGPWNREFLNIRALRTHKKHGTFCIANRSALSERVAQENLSQFNSLDLALPWFVARRSIQLSYGRAAKHFTVNSLRQVLLRFQPRVLAHSGARVRIRWMRYLSHAKQFK